MTQRPMAGIKIARVYNGGDTAVANCVPSDGVFVPSLAVTQRRRGVVSGDCRFERQWLKGRRQWGVDRRLWAGR